MTAQSAGGQAVAAPADPSTLVPAPRPEDVSSPHAVTLALYDVISGDPGVKRDWNRFRSLFHPSALMIPTGKNAETGKIGARIMTPEDYVNLSGPNLEKNGFHEREVAYREDRYGNTAHIFTTYAARRTLSDPEPFMRGINSIQFFNDGKRWWVLSITWSAETPETPIPQEYMTSQK
ncbi:hypothetical protein [Sphingosinicella rhizophila]|uniref:Nuclear transport factor 2 family protein n=1 Tax=Sphingosinicella rhizophila TaxID=3050082 RepID=A0ABU3QBQ9_9SPHN|nr:hypothetical protein [Sphingosinicella sp. GR2756]MDT9600762.1 hypothetical protein [Sphingosinicella sp. GR2756]